MREIRTQEKTCSLQKKMAKRFKGPCLLDVFCLLTVMRENNLRKRYTRFVELSNGWIRYSGIPTVSSKFLKTCTQHQLLIIHPSGSKGDMVCTIVISPEGIGQYDSR